MVAETERKIMPPKKRASTYSNTGMSQNLQTWLKRSRAPAPDDVQDEEAASQTAYNEDLVMFVPSVSATESNSLAKDVLNAADNNHTDTDSDTGASSAASQSDDNDSDTEAELKTLNTQCKEPQKRKSTNAKYPWIVKVSDGYLCSVCSEKGPTLQNRLNKGTWITKPLPIRHSKKLYAKAKKRQQCIS